MIKFPDIFGSNHLLTYIVLEVQTGSPWQSLGILRDVLGFFYCYLHVNEIQRFIVSSLKTTTNFSDFVIC